MNYTSWVGERPTALQSFDQMMTAAKGKKMILFLDYDGTLSLIVDDPNSPFMSEEVREFVQLSNVYYAGSHGMDIMAPPRPVKSSDGQGTGVLFQPAKKFLPAIQKILKELEAVTTTVKGARVEDNMFCVSMHFREVS